MRGIPGDFKAAGSIRAIRHFAAVIRPPRAASVGNHGGPVGWQARPGWLSIPELFDHCWRTALRKEQDK